MNKFLKSCKQERITTEGKRIGILTASIIAYAVLNWYNNKQFIISLKNIDLARDVEYLDGFIKNKEEMIKNSENNIIE